MNRSRCSTGESDAETRGRGDWRGEGTEPWRPLAPNASFSGMPVRPMADNLFAFPPAASLFSSRDEPLVAAEG